MSIKYRSLDVSQSYGPPLPVTGITFLPLRFPRHENLRGSEGLAPQFTTTALDGFEWSASLVSLLTLCEIVFSAHWVGRRIGLDVVEYRKITCICEKSKACGSARS
jgi:hypothetical protein